ncbi:MAG: dihydrofolate reductase family protein [Rhodothermaceae bacterium]|nr:dihydrofolate reductase family protein [Rhodothermaceae bacterium]
MSLLPYTILSSAISLDGYLNDTSEERLLLSHPKDFERIDSVRAACDGILVGAHTLRVDNPSLQIRSHSLIQQRVEAGNPQHPARITLTSSGTLPPSHTFFDENGSAIFVYCPSNIAINLDQRLKDTPAQIISLDEAEVNPRSLLMDLKKRKIHRLLIEGGEQIATAFLTAGLINELQIAIAPFFVGDSLAPKFVRSGIFHHNKNNRMDLLDTKMVGDMAVLTYKLQTPHYESES